MSTHPNVILMVALKPHDLARKTYRAILVDAGVVGDDDDIAIGIEGYSHMVMEGDYDENYQISSDVGDIVVFNLVTYGYGEAISWEKLEAEKAELDAWARGTCDRHRCSYEIKVTANYW